MFISIGVHGQNSMKQVVVFGVNCTLWRHTWIYRGHYKLDADALTQCRLVFKLRARFLCASEMLSGEVEAVKRFTRHIECCAAMSYDLMYM